MRLSASGLTHKRQSAPLRPRNSTPLRAYSAATPASSSHRSSSTESCSAKSRLTSRQRAIRSFMPSTSRRTRSNRSGAGFSESMPSARRMRASGVRRSCEIPASKVVRLASSSSTCSPMRLNSRARVASSVGPVSASDSGLRPWPMRCVAAANRARGAISQRASQAEVIRVTSAPTEKISSMASHGCTSTRLAGKPTRTFEPATGRSAQYHCVPSSLRLVRSSTTSPARALRNVSSKRKYGSMRAKLSASPDGSCTWRRCRRPMRSCNPGRSATGVVCQAWAVSIISAAKSRVA
jgi:hypothetical protein